MQRRRFLHAAGALSAGAALPALATLPHPAFARSADTRPGSVLRAFSDAFADVPETRGPVQARFRGRLPDGFRGTLYRNGPARMQRGATHYRHWFDGDGMAQSYLFADGQLTHRAAMIRTAKYVAEERAGRFLWSAFGTAMPDSAPVRGPDEVNAANISVLPVGGELLALWEAGSPYRLDPANLATLGRKVWSPETDGAPFSAHPHVDPDGTVWSFGYMTGSGKLLLYRLDRGGTLAGSTLIDAPNADMVHDFAVTERHLVFLLIPLLADEGERRPGAAFIDRFRWHGERASVVLVVDKATMQVVRRAELPAMAMFHFGNAWEEGGLLRMQFVRIADFMGLMDEITDATEGRPMRRVVGSRLHEVRLELASGRAVVEPLNELTVEFPRFDPRHAGRRSGSLFVAHRTPSMAPELFGFNAVARIEVESGRSQQFSYGDQMIAEEHLFVPRPGAAEGDGWLVGTALDWRRRHTLVSVFDARRLADGPLARAELPYLMPPGLHGAWLAAPL